MNARRRNRHFLAGLTCRPKMIAERPMRFLSIPEGLIEIGAADLARALHLEREHAVQR